MAKELRPTHEDIACDICGRTILKGERIEPYLAPGGKRHVVCELCTDRAYNEGWIREGADNTTAVRAHGSRSPRSFLDRLRSRRDNGAPREVELPYSSSSRTRVERLPATADGTAPAGEESSTAEDPRGGPPASLYVERPRPRVEAPRHGMSREPRHVRAIPTNADLKMGRALDVFNASPHPRRVAGVSRSLGVPFATVLPSITEGSIVTIVVAWELCWYRYEVDLADEAAGVRVLAQGAELSELNDDERHPNAIADERGVLALAE